MITIPLVFMKLIGEVTLPNSFIEARVIIIPKTGEGLNKNKIID